ncbi:Sulfite exporter TauE/SafE [compost metagenome]
MGLFVTAYAVYGRMVKVRPARLAGLWAVPMGTVGGLFGALFGSGGFLYAIYLSARLENKEQVRATQSALISCSTVVRLTLFLIAGVYADQSLLRLAACLLPVMVVGLWVGRRLTSRLSREAFVRLVTWLVLASGLALIGRYLSA